MLSLYYSGYLSNLIYLINWKYIKRVRSSSLSPTQRILQIALRMWTHLTVVVFTIAIPATTVISTILLVIIIRGWLGLKGIFIIEIVFFGGWRADWISFLDVEVICSLGIVKPQRWSLIVWILIRTYSSCLISNQYITIVLLILIIKYSIIEWTIELIRLPRSISSFWLLIIIVISVVAFL